MGAAIVRLGRPAQWGWLRDAERIDLAIYAAVERTPTPALDSRMAHLTRAADYSRLSMALAAVIATFGGRRGRRAAAMGLASTGVTAILVNLGLKPLGRRRRPDGIARQVPLPHRTRKPISPAFPSGHSATAFAFATGVGHALPQVATALRSLAALVAYSRVHVGVHYPGDVIAGGLVGTVFARLTTHALDHR